MLVLIKIAFCNIHSTTNT